MWSLSERERKIIQMQQWRPVWPDVGVKVAQILPKVAKKYMQHKSEVIQTIPKICQSFWLLLWYFLSPWRFKYRPIWSRWWRWQLCAIAFTSQLAVLAWFGPIHVYLTNERTNILTRRRRKSWAARKWSEINTGEKKISIDIYLPK